MLIVYCLYFDVVQEMILEEYEKVLVDKCKVLEEVKVFERMVEVDKEFEKMQFVFSKKFEEDIFIKLVSWLLFKFMQSEFVFCLSVDFFFVIYVLFMCELNMQGQEKEKVKWENVEKEEKFCKVLFCVDFFFLYVVFFFGMCQLNESFCLVVLRIFLVVFNQFLLFSSKC